MQAFLQNVYWAISTSSWWRGWREWSYSPWAGAAPAPTEAAGTVVGVGASGRGPHYCKHHLKQTFMCRFYVDFIWHSSLFIFLLHLPCSPFNLIVEKISVTDERINLINVSIRSHSALFNVRRHILWKILLFTLLTCAHFATLGHLWLVPT